MISALYLRVSKSDESQTVENQRRILHQAAEAKGWAITAEYTDTASGKSRERRPGLAKALAGARTGQYNILMCWDLTRLGRSTLDLLQIANELKQSGTALYMHQQQIDTASPGGQMFFSILAAFAQYERDQIIARTSAGLARARAQGVRLGRPALDTRQQAKALKLLYTGHTCREVARLTGISKSAVDRLAQSARNSTCTNGD